MSFSPQFHCVWPNAFNMSKLRLQVEQKLSEMKNTTADARKRGATGDRDSIRASVLDEAAIVRVQPYYIASEIDFTSHYQVVTFLETL